MRILAIETSCDETAFAIVSYDGERFVVEQQALHSQMKTHAVYGGVVPEVAARLHVETIIPLLESLSVSKDGAGIDAIAVTKGPGLVVALRVGVECAKTLAVLWKKPLVAVNHLEGHLASAWLSHVQPEVPVLSLLVSGGHTEIVQMRAFGDYELLGSTRDDAAGEAFDKVAKLLGLEYPGGPEISKRALLGNKDAIALPRPMLAEPHFDFSFSGLKTAVLREIQSQKSKIQQLDEAFVNDLSASFQEAVVETLVTKTMRAVEQVNPKTVTLVGGVSANERLREVFSEACGKVGVACVIPERRYSTDNAVMIAVAGIKRFQAGEAVDPFALVADPHFNLSSSQA